MEFNPFSRLKFGQPKKKKQSHSPRVSFWANYCQNSPLAKGWPHQQRGKKELKRSLFAKSLTHHHDQL
jgi:hypothetical protein